uniref:Toxin of toxin-antitoxin module n=1 Tax=Pseudomonas sp. GLE121 TaxID=1329969 RepID=R4LD94_9PSED|nr:type II toxin-antitoxin system RelE/ParE family toxin [Pseudomonas sp. GLE121]AGL12842.1 toxin of toxin-antitoxin module [Pseudomonas sp. GLE121]
MHRVFKTKGFTASAKKGLITDEELCKALQEVMNGQADDLGGGVWKKRLNKNRHRSILLAKGRSYWVYQFLFAKQDQANITQKELAAFKELAKAYEGLSLKHVQQLVDQKEFVEICNDQKIQK